MAYRTVGTDRILESAPVPGTLAVSLGNPVLGFRGFGNVLAAGDTCAYFIEGVDANGVPTGAWERGFGTYQSAALARTVVVDSSNAGALVNFQTAVRIGCSEMSDTVTVAPAPGGRLTVSSTNPVADGSGSKVYYLPYLHDKVPVFDGAGLRTVTIPAGLSLDLSSLGGGVGYDIFGYASGLGLALDPPLAWSNLNARATTLTWSNGFLCKTGDPTRRLLGSFCMAGTGQLVDTFNTGNTAQPARRMLWNTYNRVPRQFVMIDTTGSWSYATNAWRIIRGLTNPNGCFEMFRGMDEDAVIINGLLGVNGAVNAGMAAGICIDAAASILDWGVFYNTVPNPCYGGISIAWTGLPGYGYHYMGLCEYSIINGTASNAGWNWASCGLWGTVRA
jgi:hypothetical protein